MTNQQIQARYWEFAEYYRAALDALIAIKFTDQAAAMIQDLSWEKGFGHIELSECQEWAEWRLSLRQISRKD